MVNSRNQRKRWSWETTKFVRRKGKNAMKIRKNENRFSIQFGGVNGEAYMFRISFFRKIKPLIRISIHFNTEKLIKIFGYNQKVINLFN